MAGSATDYLRPAVLGHTLGFQAYTMPTTIYVALCTSPPAAATPGAEVSGGSYVRMAATFALAAGRTDLAANTTTIEWPSATAAWGSVGWFELRDANAAGNRLYWGPLVDPADGITPIIRAIVPGDILRLSAGVLQVQAT